MRIFGIGLLSLMLGSCLVGCATSIRDKGAWYLEWGTRVEVGSEASQTASEAKTEVTFSTGEEESAPATP